MSHDAATAAAVRVRRLDERRPGASLGGDALSCSSSDGCEHEVVLADRAFSAGSSATSCWSYAEVAIVHAGRGGFVAVGVVQDGYKVGRQPGWEPGSYAWHSDDGQLYESQPDEKKATQRACKFGAGDVVGCGVHAVSGAQWLLFWTLNGKKLDLGVTLGPPQLLPYFLAVGMGSPDCRVSFNFGATPFRFDLAALPVPTRRVGDCARPADTPKASAPVEAMDANMARVGGVWHLRRSLQRCLHEQPAGSAAVSIERASAAAEAAFATPSEAGWQQGGAETPAQLLCSDGAATELLSSTRWAHPLHGQASCGTRTVFSDSALGPAAGLLRWTLRLRTLPGADGPACAIVGATRRNHSAGGGDDSGPQWLPAAAEGATSAWGVRRCRQRAAPRGNRHGRV